MADYIGTLAGTTTANGSYSASGTYGGKTAYVNADSVWLYAGTAVHGDPAWLCHTTKGTVYTSAYYYVSGSGSTPNTGTWTVSAGGSPGLYLTPPDSAISTDLFDDSSLNAAWTAVLNSGTISETSNAGFLTVTSGAGNIWDSVFTPTWAYLFLSGDFDKYCKINVTPTGSWHSAGLIVSDLTGANCAWIARVHNGSNNYVVRGDKVSGLGDYKLSAVVSWTTGWQRTKRVGSTFTCYYAASQPSVDGDWTEVDHNVKEFTSSAQVRIGLEAHNSCPVAKFDFLSDWPPPPESEALEKTVFDRYHLLNTGTPKTAFDLYHLINSGQKTAFDRYHLINSFTKTALDCYDLNIASYIKTAFDSYHLRGLLLWSKLGTSGEITSPAKGPAGAILSPFTDCFEAGKFGNALRHPAQAAIQAAGAVIAEPNWDTGNGRYPNSQGTVECWLNLPRLPDSDTALWALHSYNCGPLPTLETLPENVAAYRARFRAIANFDGNLYFQVQKITTENYTRNLASCSISTLTGWHHFAFVWNQDGISGGADTARIYIDGVQAASGSQTFDFGNRVTMTYNTSRFLVWPSATVTGGAWQAAIETATYTGEWPDAILDNFIVWNLEKTDFSTMGDETPSLAISPRKFFFDRYNMGALLARVGFDRFDLRNEATPKTVYDRYDMGKAVEKFLFDAYHIAGTMTKTSFDQWHLFTTASAKLKTLYDRYQLYGAACKTLVDMYHILGEVLKTSFDRFNITEGHPAEKAIFDLYRIYQTAGYLIFWNGGDGGPVDYSTSIGFTTGTTWSAAGLSTCGNYRFGVRTRGELFEEKNTNVVDRLEIDAVGVEIAARPNRVESLAATPAAGGKITLKWAYRQAGGAAAATHFHVYSGTDSCSLSIVDSVNKAVGEATVYQWTSEALSDGIRHYFRVRAATAADREDNGAQLADAIPDTTAADGFAAVSFKVI